MPARCTTCRSLSLSSDRLAPPCHGTARLRHGRPAVRWPKRRRGHRVTVRTVASQLACRPPQKKLRVSTPPGHGAAASRLARGDAAARDERIGCQCPVHALRLERRRRRGANPRRGQRRRSRMRVRCWATRRGEHDFCQSGAAAFVAIWRPDQVLGRKKNRPATHGTARLPRACILFVACAVCHWACVVWCVAGVSLWCVSGVTPRMPCIDV